MQLLIFAFEQACYVHQAARTCEREEILRDTPTLQTLNTLRTTPQGFLYLNTVNVADINRENKDFGSFALAVTGDRYLPDDIIGSHAELP